MRILCGGPVSEDAPVFEAHIKGLQSQGFELDYKGIDGSPIPLQIPRGFRSVDWRVGNPSGDYKEQRVRWTYYRLALMAELREEMRIAALERGYDYLFMLDADMIPGPTTLKYMLDAKKDIIGGLCWTDSKFRKGHRFPNVWSLENHKPNAPPCIPPSPELMAKLKSGGVHEVEITGGCYLISKSVLERVSYKPWPKIISEDVSFALTARKEGIPIFVHCDVYIEHRRRR